MSDAYVPRPRPVSLFTIVFLFAVFAAFLLVIRYFYHPTTTPAFTGTPENITKETEWRSNPATRRQALNELQENQVKHAGKYGWVDQKAGVVQLPIERAMELTARDLSSKQQVRQIRDLPSDKRGKL
jgi:hypothetical protein